MAAISPGTLYLVPVLLGSTEVSDVLPENTIQVARTLTSFIAENAKSARAFLKQLPSNHTLQDITVLEMDKHSGKIDFNFYFERLRSGTDTGLVSEAGMPGIADPGAAFVLQAHKEGIKVVPLTGPSSIFLALAASGMNGQGFIFHGYLPKETEDLEKKIKILESLSRDSTQIWIEAPYRSMKMLQFLKEKLTPDTLLCVATNLTSKNQRVVSQSVLEWKKSSFVLGKEPAIFLIYTSESIEAKRIF